MDLYQKLLYVFKGISILVGAIMLFRKDSNKYLKLCSLLLLIDGISEAIGYLMIIKKGSNHLELNMFALINFPLIFLIFREMIPNQKVKSYLLYSCIIYPIIAILLLLPSPLKKPWNSTNWEIGSIGVIGFGIYYFYELFQFPLRKRLLAQPDFWIATSFVVYYVTTIPMYAVNNFIGGYPDNFIYAMYIIMNFANYVMYILFTVAFICALINSQLLKAISMK